MAREIGAPAAASDVVPQIVLRRGRGFQSSPSRATITGDVSPA
jgi:hypothetical protein